MESHSFDKLLSRLKSPKELLNLLRFLILPMVVMSSLAYPWAVLASIFATDSGTHQAMRAGYLIFFGSTFYVLAVVLAAIKWSDWAMVSAILLAPVTIVNIAGLVFFPSVVSVVPWIAIGFLGVSVPESAAQIVGLSLFAFLFVVVPIVSIWRLVRHSFELDVRDYSQPVELWDLKKINK